VVCGVPVAERAQAMRHEAMQHVFGQRPNRNSDNTQVHDDPSHGHWRGERDVGEQELPYGTVDHEIGAVFGLAVLNRKQSQGLPFVKDPAYWGRVVRSVRLQSRCSSRKGLSGSARPLPERSVRWRTDVPSNQRYKPSIDAASGSDHFHSQDCR
jgi:hypothetical protein